MRKLIILTVLAILTLSSCEKLDLTENTDTKDSGAKKTLRILTRSITASDISYPVAIYAFDADGRCKGDTVITAADDDAATLSLSKGTYHITAVSLPDGYPSVGTVSTDESTIEMPEGGYGTGAVMLGAADVTLSSSSQTANIQLGYRQASVNISLSDIPSNISKVNATIGTPYTSMTLAGEYSSADVISIPCTKEDDIWTTGTVYVYPTQNSQPVLTINMTKDNGETNSYSYTYNSALQAATPYIFNGSYSGSTDLSLTANISAGEWGTPVTESFSFGPGSVISGGGSEVKVSSFPEDGDIWNGHIVAYADSTDSECNVVLVSLKEWEGVYSQYNADHSTDAVTIASDYEEGGLTGWTIPTKDEATMLRNIYGVTSNLTILNNNITQTGGTALSVIDSSSKNVRYLCESATYTYNLKTSSSVLAAGATVKYRLRLVKELKLIK